MDGKNIKIGGHNFTSIGIFPGLANQPGFD